MLKINVFNLACFDQDMDYFWGPLINHLYGVESEQECLVHCKETENCAIFVWGHELSYVPKQCFLKAASETEELTKVPLEYIISGPKLTCEHIHP